MGRIIDITSKLGFDENPKLKIKDEELELNADAESVLKIMGYMGAGDSITPQDIEDAFQIVFTPDSYKKLKKMKLNFQDYQTVFQIAVDVITGTEEEDTEGNAQTPDTIWSKTLD